MYTAYNIVVIGTLFLGLYILVDFIKNRTRNLIRRIVFYSFIFYLLNVLEITTGGLIFPPQSDFEPTVQLVPLYFIGDLFMMYDSKGLDWFFWNSAKLTLFNIILLMPLGIYLSFFRIRRVGRALKLTFLVSLTIETIQLIFPYLGIVQGRGFNVDDLIMNTTGGVIGFLVMRWINRISRSNLLTVKRDVSQ